MIYECQNEYIWWHQPPRKKSLQVASLANWLSLEYCQPRNRDHYFWNTKCEFKIYLASLMLIARATVVHLSWYSVSVQSSVVFDTLCIKLVLLCIRVWVLYLCVLKPGSYTCRGSNIHWVVQQNKWNKCLGPLKHQVPQLLNLINGNMVLCISAFSISLLISVWYLPFRDCYSRSFITYSSHLLSCHIDSMMHLQWAKSIHIYKCVGLLTRYRTCKHWSWHVPFYPARWTIEN